MLKEGDIKNMGAECPKCGKVRIVVRETACPDCGVLMRATAARKGPQSKPPIPHKRYRKENRKRGSK